MGKISPVSSKYIVHATIEIEGVVDKPDVIGAIFGQTEGLLGNELELRELQRSGRIGRIEVNMETRSGKTRGTIIIPSSLDKAETAIVAAALEVIQRIGPCNAMLKIDHIEDVRITKRIFVVNRAKELLKDLMENVMPDSQELADEVTSSVRAMEVQEYGRDRLPAGPAVDESNEIIVVEGRADVINLLKHGIKNVIAMNGTSVPPTIIELSRRKEITVFVDGDRGGDLIVKELINVCEIDYVTKAPAGMEVEEITKKEIHKALRSRIAVEQVKMELGGKEIHPVPKERMEKEIKARPQVPEKLPQKKEWTPEKVPPAPRGELTPADKEKFGELLDDLIGTRGAYILDNNLNILGKVPLIELQITLKSLQSSTPVYAIVFDGVVEKELLKTAEEIKVSYLVAMDSKVREPSKVRILTSDEL